MAVHKAVVPAAGLGTRFLPATKAQPKEMLVLVDKPAIQYIVEEGVAAGVRNFLVVTGRNKKSLEDHFDRAPELEAALRQKGEWELLATVEETARLAAVHYVRQPEARGLGDAVACAAAFVGDEDFAVLLPDDLILADPPCLAQMLAVKEAYGGAVVALEEVEPAQTQRYGIIRGREIDRGVWRIDDLVEKPTPAEAPSHLAVVGRYLLPGRLFPILAATPPGAGGEIQLTDALRVLARDYPLYGYLFTGRRFDVGDKLGFLTATVELALARPDLGPAFAAYLRRILL
ncbi:MAG: UTP--glucose-1-phosphate uridylyltransferase GalU [Clostridia bacterium]|nr:UTP--glucose-1-phosphate uridylyltransferase GalU [Clostridia bacterium]